MSSSVVLPGSAFHMLGAPRPGHHRAGELTAGERRLPIDLTLMLRPEPVGPAHPAGDQDLVTHWAQTAGLQVTGEDPVTHRLTVSGEADRLAGLFGVRLERFFLEAPQGELLEYRGFTGPVWLPGALAGVVTGVFGLDDRPIARSHLRTLAQGRMPAMAYDPPRLAEIYRYPRLLNDGEGMELVAGMIELGGVTHPLDVALAFSRLGLEPPVIENVWLDGAAPLPDPEGADVEVALDYQVLGAMVMAMAPKARLTIVVYNAPNSERGFIDAVATAAGDQRRRPAAVSISWGAPEDHWSVQGMRAMDSAFAIGSRHGVTYSAAAGDAGSTNNETDRRQHAEFPASSPHVWACGGTTLIASDDRIVSESVWNEMETGAGIAGSGVSRVFATPAYQSGAGLRPRSADDGLPGRGLPDGSGDADPLTGWNIVALRELRTTGGTSAVAPMYTALWTLLAGLRDEPLGAPHEAVYAARGQGFNDVTSGNTGGPYVATKGWDLASGWGSPRGVDIAREMNVTAPNVQVREVQERELA
jgi:kumamolisin